MYSWNIDDLNKLLNYYLSLQDKTTDPQLVVDYQNTINSIETLLLYYKEQTTKKISYEIISFRDTINEDFDCLTQFGKYMSIVKHFRDSFDGHLIEVDFDLQKVDVSDGFIVKLANNFYTRFGGIFSKSYQSLASNFTDRLWFRNCGKKMTYNGYTHRIYGSDDVFIEVFRNKTIQDFITFFHEDGHGITSKINPNMKYDYKKYCFMETDALFFELLATFYIGAKLGMQDECSKIRLSTFNDYLCSAEMLCAKQLYITGVNGKINSRLKQIKFYMRELNYSLKNAIDTVNFSVDENLNYVISYLTAVELFLIYLTNPIKALDLLHQIILLSNLSSDEYLLKIQEMGLEPGKNINSFYELINDEKEVLKLEKKI